MRRIVLQRVEYDETKVNTNNHPKDPGDEEAKDLDYRTEITKTSLINWRELINYPVVFEWTFTEKEVQVLLDSMKEVQVLLDSMKVSLIVRRLSSLHQEELDEIVERLDRELPSNSSGWFFRFARSSPKDGLHDWPIMSASQVIEQVVTSHRARQALLMGQRTLYFCEYLPHWDPHREVWVFIYRGRITAISQYTARSLFFLKVTDEELERIALRIVDYISALMPRLIEAFSTSNFTCDIYVEDDSVRIIEFNSFGYWLAAGSCHFHWLTDKTLLYGTGDELYFRIGMSTE